MAKETKISWCEATWNPWYGCHKVSPGCANCYAERWAKRSDRDFEQITKAKDATLYAPLKWKEPRVIFTCSLSDFFIEGAELWRNEAWEVIHQTPHHIYLILTKRPELALGRIPWHRKLVHTAGQSFITENSWPHVRLGVSAENQYWLDRRLPEILKIPAAGYFVSAEPLLGPVDFSRRLGRVSNIQAVIAGGESGGPEHRSLVKKPKADHGGPHSESWWLPTDEALRWVRAIRDQCAAAGVKFILKQWGGPRPDSGGRLLDGKTHDGYPI